MEGKNPREGCAALVLRHYRQRRAGVARIRQTWLPTGRIRQPNEASQPACGAGPSPHADRLPTSGAVSVPVTCPIERQITGTGGNPRQPRRCSGLDSCRWSRSASFPDKEEVDSRTTVANTVAKPLDDLCHA